MSFKPYTPEELGGGCPIVLYAQELDMRQRQFERVIEDFSEHSPEELIDQTVIDGNSANIFAPSGQFFSERGFASVDETIPRQVAVTPIYAGKLTPEGYRLYQPDRFDNTVIIRSLLRQNVAPMTARNPVDQTDLFIQHHHPLDHPSHIRNGVLTVLRDDQHVPVGLTVDGKVHFMEVKGSGNALGVMIPTKDRFYETITYGGLPWGDAKKEFTNLIRAYEAGLTPVIPVALGKLSMSDKAYDDFGQLGVVMRLTPSTLRLSYRGFSAEVPLDSPEDARVMVCKLVDNFLQKFFLPDDAPIFISPASHLENYLVEDELAVSETDFEDFRELGTGDFPFIHTQTTTQRVCRLSLLIARIWKISPENYGNNG